MQSLGEPSVNHNDNSTLEYSHAEGWNALSSTRCLIRGGTRCLQRVAKTDAALPPDMLRLRSEERRVGLRGGDPRWRSFSNRNEKKPIHLHCLRANGSMTKGQSSALAHKP